MSQYWQNFMLMFKCSSVINKRDELELYIIENKPSIIGVTESWQIVTSEIVH